MRNYFVCLVCAAALLGCKNGKDAAGAASGVSGNAGSAVPAGSAGSAASSSTAGSVGIGAATGSTDKAGLTVLDQGAEPRAQLQYKIAPGTKQAFTLAVDMNMDMGAAMGGKMKLPSMQMDGE